MRSPEQPPQGTVPPEPSSKEEGVLSRLKASNTGKAARAFVLAAMATGAAGALRAEEPPAQPEQAVAESGSDWDDGEEILAASQAAPEVIDWDKLSESDWVEQAKSQPLDVLTNIETIETAPFAYRVVETATEADPSYGFLTTEHWKRIPDADKLLDRVVRTLLHDNQETAEEVLDSPEKIEHLSGFKGYYREAAEKSSYIGVIYNMAKIFTYLPRPFAESIVQNALATADDQEPFLVMAKAGEIRKYLPDPEWRINKTINYFADMKPNQAFLNMDVILPAIRENERASFVERLLRNDPAGAYQYLRDIRLFGDSSADELSKLVKDSGSPEAYILLQILEAEDIPDEVKERLPLLLDELVFNKQLTLKEAADIAKDGGKLLKLVGEITHRSNYLGAASIREFLSAPASNQIASVESM